MALADAVYTGATAVLHGRVKGDPSEGRSPPVQRHRARGTAPPPVDRAMAAIGQAAPPPAGGGRQGSSPAGELEGASRGSGLARVGACSPPFTLPRSGWWRPLILLSSQLPRPVGCFASFGPISPGSMQVRELPRSAGRTKL